MVLGVTSGSYVRWFQGLTVWAGTGSRLDRVPRGVQGGVAVRARRAAGGVDWYRLLRDYNASGQADPAMPEPDWPRATYGLTDVFSDRDHGWATGYDNVKNESVVLRTSNGGRLWKTARPSDGGAYSANALTVTPAGALGRRQRGLGRRPDLAQRGPGRRLGVRLGADARVPARHPGRLADPGYAAGTGGAMLRTADGGATWKKVATAPKGDLFGLHFAERDRGLGAGERRPQRQRARAAHHRRRRDRGRRRRPCRARCSYAVDSAGQDVWVAGGDPSAGPVLGGERVSGDGVLLHSADGGATWETQWGGGAADLRLSDVDMLDADVGWAVGDGSAAQKALVLHTTDGGDTWTPQDPG